MKKSMTCHLKPESADDIKAIENACDWMQVNGFPNEKIRSCTVMIEELIRYSRQIGRNSSTPVKRTLTLGGNPDSSAVSLMMPVDESAEKDLQNLDRMLQCVKGYQNRSEGMEKLQARFSKKPTPQGPDHLSLISMSIAENADLDFYVNERYVLMLTVVWPDKILRRAEKRFVDLAKGKCFFN